MREVTRSSGRSWETLLLKFWKTMGHRLPRKAASPPQTTAEHGCPGAQGQPGAHTPGDKAWQAQMGHSWVFLDTSRSDSTGAGGPSEPAGGGPTTGEWLHKSQGPHAYQELQKPVETWTQGGKAQPWFNKLQQEWSFCLLGMGWIQLRKRRKTSSKGSPGHQKQLWSFPIIL